METWKRAQNMQVVSLAEGALIGRLDDFQFDLETHRIYGWRLKGMGMFARAGGAAAGAIKLIGRDVAFIEAEKDVEWSGAKPNAADGRAWASAYEGMEVMSRRGSGLGAVKDFVLDVPQGRITGLILHGNKLLRLDDEVNTGPDVIIAGKADQLVQLAEDEPRETRWSRVSRSLRLTGKDEDPEDGKDE